MVPENPDLSTERHRLGSKRIITLIAILGGFSFMPFLFSNISLFTHVLILSIFAIGFNIYLGHTGLGSFGHNLFYGISAYTTGLLLLNYTSNFLVILISIAVTVAAASAIGVVVFIPHGPDTHEAYLFLIFLAFASFFKFLFRSPLAEISGGYIGLAFPKPPIDFGVFSISYDKVGFFFLCLGIFAIFLILSEIIIKSPLGRIFHAISENERRAQFLGYNTYKYKVLALSISALFAGVAGGLYAVNYAHVAPEIFKYTIGAEVVFVCLIGGMDGIWTPFFGSAFYLIMKDLVAGATEAWMFYVGVIIVGIVLYFPGGMHEGFTKIEEKIGGG